MSDAKRDSEHSYGHPQVFYCQCSRKYLCRVVQRIHENGTPMERWREYTDWFRPNAPITHCRCGKRLELVFDSRPKPRDAVFVDGRRVV